MLAGMCEGHREGTCNLGVIVCAWLENLAFRKDIARARKGSIILLMSRIRRRKGAKRSKNLTQLCRRCHSAEELVIVSDIIRSGRTPYTNQVRASPAE